MRRRWIGAALALVLLAAGRNTTEAREIRQGDQCVVEANEVIEGNLFVLCRTLEIRGRVEGDLIGAAANATILGSVAGDVYFLAGQLDVAGRLGEDLHFGGAVLHLLPATRFEDERADLISVSLATTLDDGVALPDSIVNAGYQLVMDGDAGGEVNFWGSALAVNGLVGGSVAATVGDPQATGISQLQTFLTFGWDVQLVNPGLVVTDRGAIGGDLDYSGPAAGDIAGTVDGVTTFTQVVVQPDLTQIINEDDGGESGLGLLLSQIVREFIILTLVGVIGLVLVPRPLQSPARAIQTRPLPSLGVGLLAFIISFPIAAIVLGFVAIIIVVLLLLQIDGLAVALTSGTLLGVWAGGTALFFFAVFFLSRVIVFLHVGRALVRLTVGDDGSQRITFLGLIAGTAVFSVVVSLPVIGLLVSAVAAFVGLGAMLIVIQNNLRVYRDRVFSPPRSMPVGRPRRPGELRQLPPPIINDSPAPLGMDNLPEGFDPAWWDE